jgi:hypothetical protein
LAQQQEDLAQATTLYTESMLLNAEVGDRQGVAASLVGLAAVAEATEQWVRAARLLGAAES